MKTKVRTICKECREFYCKDCSESHSLQKISKHHTMFDLLATYCDICHGKGIHSKVQTICKECRELYCKECSTSHSLQKVSKSHTLIDLDPQGGNSKTADTSEIELSSDFLQYLSVRENTGLYRAQVAVDGGASARKDNTKITTERDVKLKSAADRSTDPAKLRPDKCGEFGIKRPDDKKDVYISGILALSGKVIVNDAFCMIKKEISYHS